MTRAEKVAQPLARHKSRTVSDTVDPRAERTRALISEAFLHWLGRRPYTRIGVSDIARKAGVGRATFYAHFDSKDALLRAELDRAVLPMLVPLPNDPCRVDGTALFAHLQHARDIYRALTGGTSRAVTERIIQDALEAHVALILAQSSGRLADTHAAPTFVPRFVAATLLTLIAWSLEQTEAPTPAELQALFRRLVGRALQLGD